MEEADKKDYQSAIKSVVQHLKCKRKQLQNDIDNDELEKAQLVGEVNKLQDRITILNANLKKKSEFRSEYDKAITQSEENFLQLLQKSEDFLTLTKREALALSEAVCDVPPMCKDKGSDRKEPSCALSPTPPQVAAPPNGDRSCMGCGTGPACATIMIPYKANGL